MATIDTVCFGLADTFVSGNPDLDGLVDYDTLPYHDEPETGYTLGSKLTYAGGGFPRVVFKGVHYTQKENGTAEDRLVLGFMVRFDTSFDEDDFILIAFRESAALNAPRRMIMIRPNIFDEGAAVGTGDADIIAAKPALAPYEIKRKHPPKEMHHYREAAGGAWTEHFPTAPIDVVVRSWKPGRIVGAEPECCWSIEVSVPRVSANGWINLNSGFGLYFNVNRINRVAMAISQSSFPTNSPPLNDFPGENYPNADSLPWGKALVPAPGDPNTGVGVHFRNDWQGIGRREQGSNTETLTGTIDGNVGGGTDNELVALVENTGEADADKVSAEFRFRNWGVPGANFWDKPLGMLNNPTLAKDLPANNGSDILTSQWPKANVPPAYSSNKHQCMVVELSSPNNVNFNQVAIRRNMDFVHLSEVEREAEISGEGYDKPADGSGEIQFILQTFCRKIEVAERLMEKEITNPEVRQLIESSLELTRREGSQPIPGTRAAVTKGWKNSVVYVWTTIASRRTGSFMKIKGDLYEILDETPGEFGLAAYHEGLTDKFSFSFEGPGLVQYAPGSYGIRVPWGGTTRIKVKIGADREGPEGDVSTRVPKEPWPKPGTVGPGGDNPGNGPGPNDLPKGCLALLMGIFGKKQA